MLKEIIATKTSTDYQKNIEVLLNSKLCSHRLQIEFTLYCNEGLEQYYDFKAYSKVYEARRRCLELVADYLAEPSEAKVAELEAAAEAARVARAEANAAWAAAWAARAEANAAWAARAANSDNKTTKLKELYEWLFSRLTEGMNREVVGLLYET